MKSRIALVMFAACPSLVFGQSPESARTTVPDVRALGDSVAGHGSALHRTRRLVYWINDRYDWSYTDYERRTPEEVIARRAGNCAELASVLHLFLDSLEIRTRWAREINVQPSPSPRRQETAAELVEERGNAYSVFGLQHNDHVWLEVWDDSTAAWFPADPAYGVAGLADWSATRLAMEDRPKPRVEAVEPIAADMLVPFVQQLYGDEVVTLPSWPGWVAVVRGLAPHARAAFAGEENLHAFTSDIAALKAVYDSLVEEAAERGLAWR